MAEKPKILVVEDDSSIRKLLVTLLEEGGYEVMECGDGDEAVSAFYEKKPDIIISDIGMPKMNGKELCRIIRQDYSEDLIPFIFLSARSEISNKREGFELGADDFIVKPFEGDDLLLRVKAKLDRSKVVKRLTSHDDLTGVYNKKAFHEKLREMVVFAHRYDREFSLAILDIDHFKDVNDRFGHQVGDFVLKQLARLLQVNMREVDRLFRIGGEEFAILIFEKPKADAKSLLERLMGILQAREFSDPRTGAAIRITVSAGVAGFPEDSTDSDDLVRLADKAMYHAKKSGRNMVCVSE
jgi:diguanylate cyclase (GGDEF)-like protein